MKAEIVDSKIVVTAETPSETELLNFMGFGKLKVTHERVVDERTSEGAARSHDTLTIDFDGLAPTPA